MKNKLLISVLVLITPVFILCNAKKAHSNHVKLIGNVHFIKGTTFSEKEYCITSGQPYKGLSSSFNAIESENGTYSILDINIKAGRHKSSHVNDCFKSWTNQSENHTIYGKYPKRLNFAVQGTLTIAYTNLYAGIEVTQHVVFEDIILAQGHSSASNKWWFGGKNCTHLKQNDTSNNSMSCKSQSGYYWCVKRHNKVNAFYITGGRCLERP